jgi:hypothetical protein
MRHALRGVDVPRPNATQHSAKHGARQARGLLERAVALVPRVAEGAVAVADVSGAGPWPHAVRERAAARHHEVVILHRQVTGRARKEGEQAAEAVLSDAKALQV